jgi:hypothetical protein
MISEPGEAEVDFLIRVLTKTREAGYAFPVEFRGEVAVAFPRSINWETLDQREFNPIAESVYALIEEALGTQIKELKANANT